MKEVNDKDIRKKKEKVGVMSFTPEFWVSFIQKTKREEVF
jgi:hypothetical protein